MAKKNKIFVKLVSSVGTGYYYITKKNKKYFKEEIVREDCFEET